MTLSRRLLLRLSGAAVLAGSPVLTACGSDSLEAKASPSQESGGSDDQDAGRVVGRGPQAAGPAPSARPMASTLPTTIPARSAAPCGSSTTALAVGLGAPRRPGRVVRTARTRPERATWTTSMA